MSIKEEEFTLVDCDKTATPRLGPGLLYSCILTETETLKCLKPLLWHIHCTTLSVYDLILRCTTFYMMRY